ncbi:unnamed protein product [Schistosoma mattheei]|uniref:Uncharacterized protein n=1 Tax=Schistosoma mattheei TaxID=31246 RepID=A0A183NSK8_9TREM|nr:unnamed protein product [Schistosoma mattheei]
MSAHAWINQSKTFALSNRHDDIIQTNSLLRQLLIPDGYQPWALESNQKFSRNLTTSDSEHHEEWRQHRRQLIKSLLNDREQWWVTKTKDMEKTVRTYQGNRDLKSGY